MLNVNDCIDSAGMAAFCVSEDNGALLSPVVVLTLLTATLHKLARKWSVCIFVQFRQMLAVLNILALLLALLITKVHWT